MEEKQRMPREEKNNKIFNERDTVILSKSYISKQVLQLS